MHLRLLDSVIAVDAPEDFLSELARFLPPSSAFAATTGRLTVRPDADQLYLSCGPGGTSERASPDAAVGVAVAMLNRLAIVQCTSFAVHAGVVARDGRVLAFPAASGTGKSTLTAALLSAGWQYISDEALVLDGRTLGVRPYPRPLALHTWTLARLGLEPPAGALDERLVLPAELGGGPCPSPGLLTDVVLLSRAAAAYVVEDSRPRATQALLSHSFNHYRDPAGAFRTAAAATAGVRAWRLDLADPVESAELLGRAVAPG